MKYKLCGVSTPFVGLSWNKTNSATDYFNWLFTFLSSKRILTNPIEMEIKYSCVQSVLEIKQVLANYPIELFLSTNDVEIIRALIISYNSYLDSLNSAENAGIIYKDQGHWVNLSFDNAMKSFRKSFRNAIAEIEKRHNIVFPKSIPEEY